MRKEERTFPPSVGKGNACCWSSCSSFKLLHFGRMKFWNVSPVPPQLCVIPHSLVYYPRDMHHGVGFSRRINLICWYTNPCNNFFQTYLERSYLTSQSTWRRLAWLGTHQEARGFLTINYGRYVNIAIVWVNNKDSKRRLINSHPRNSVGNFLGCLKIGSDL